MSSPLAARKAHPFGKALVSFHQKYAHGHRLHILSQALTQAIADIFPGDRPLRCLDVGCGDMRLSELTAEKAPRLAWTCMDVYDLPAPLAEQPRWQKYQRFDGRHFPFADGSFDVVIFSDVLHHARDKTPGLLAEAARTGRCIIVKDHFEYSLWSRCCLWTMDFVGNWGYGVPLPQRYFNQRRFRQLVAESALRLRSLTVGIDLYGHLPIANIVLRKQWQFLAVLEPSRRSPDAP